MKLDRSRKRTIKSLVLNQSVSINGHNTSVSIEGAFWNALKEIAVVQNISANALVSKIDSERQHRQFVVGHPCVCCRTLSPRRECES